METQRASDMEQPKTLTLDEFLTELGKRNLQDRIKFLTSLHEGDSVFYTAPCGQGQIWQKHEIKKGPLKVGKELIYLTEYRGQTYVTPVSLLAPVRPDQFFELPED